MGFQSPFAVPVFDGVEVAFPAKCTGVEPHFDALLLELNLHSGQSPDALVDFHQLDEMLVCDELDDVVVVIGILSGFGQCRRNGNDRRLSPL
jgi:hypothetical protein